MNIINKEKRFLDFKLFFKLFLFARKKSQINYILGFLLTIFTGLMEFTILSELSNIFLIIEGRAPRSVYKILDFCLNRNYGFCENISSAKTTYISLFILFIVFTLIIRLLSTYISQMTSASVSSDIGKKVYSKILRMNLRDYINENSGELIGICVNDITTTGVAINQFTLMLYSTILSIFIIAGMIYGGTKEIIIVVFLVLIFYSNFIYLTRKRLSRNGKVSTHSRYKAINIIQEGLGNFMNIIVSRSHFEYINKFGDTNFILRKVEAQSNFIKLTPKILIESLILIAITIVAVLISSNSLNTSLQFLLPSLGVIAVGSQRIIITLQLIFQQWSSLLINSTAANITYKRLNVEEDNLYQKIVNKDFKFNFKNLTLKDITYIHQRDNNEKSNVIKNISLELKRGDILGIVGKSGSGKSTLINIMLGLNFPQKGALKINNHNIKDYYGDKVLINYQSNISYIPQKIYLMNSSLIENITCENIESTDFENLNKVIEICDLNEIIESLPYGIKTNIGEKGSKISGGQQQKIGLARALYRRRKEIIFLDEATNALDLNSEKKIIKNIIEAKLFTTLVIITHRKENLNFCNRIIEISKGSILYEN